MRCLLLVGALWLSLMSGSVLSQDVSPPPDLNVTTEAPPPRRRLPRIASSKGPAKQSPSSEVTPRPANTTKDSPAAPGEPPPNATQAPVNVTKDAPAPPSNTTIEPSLASANITNDASSAPANTTTNPSRASANATNGASPEPSNTTIEPSLASANATNDASSAPANTTIEPSLVSANATNDASPAPSNTTTKPSPTSANATNDASTAPSNTTIEPSLASTNATNDALSALSNTTTKPSLASANATNYASSAPANTTIEPSLVSANATNDASPAPSNTTIQPSLASANATNDASLAPFNTTTKPSLVSANATNDASPAPSNTTIQPSPTSANATNGASPAPSNTTIQPSLASANATKDASPGPANTTKDAPAAPGKAFPTATPTPAKPPPSPAVPAKPGSPSSPNSPGPNPPPSPVQPPGAPSPSGLHPLPPPSTPPGAIPLSPRGSLPVQAVPVQQTPKEIFCDRTVAINDLLQNPASATDHSLHWSADESGKVPKFDLFYSTGALLSNLTALSPVANLLDQDEHTKDAHLYLSIRLTKEDEIMKDRIADLVHHVFDALPPAESLVGSLKKHVSGILLDLQANTTTSCPFADSLEEYKQKYPEYYLKWSISLPKFAKKLVHGILAKPDLKVGVLFSQLGCYKIAHQMSGADFLVIKRSFVIGHKFPLTYNRFRANLELVARYNLAFMQKIGMTNATKVTFQLNIMHNNLETNPDFQGADAVAVQKVLDRSQDNHLPLLVRFARRWAKTEGRTELILTNGLNVTSAAFNSKLSPEKWFVPHIYVQEVDTNPCQLMTMLAESSSKFRNLVLNEFTWRAFARYAAEMTPEKCPKAANIAKSPPPNNTLIFSSGIGKMWNDTEMHLKKLLDSHQTVSGWQLKSLVFSAEDIYHSACITCQTNYRSKNEIQVDRGIPKFVQEMSTKYSIGCLVEMGNTLIGAGRYDGQFDLGRNYLNGTTYKDCRAVWDVTSVVIWSFNVTMIMRLNEELSFDSERFQLKRNLLRILAARDTFIQAYPEKEVIIQFKLHNGDEFIRYVRSQPGKVICEDAVSTQRDFAKGIRVWGIIHGIKVILSPAYSFQTPMRGIWIPPAEDGTSIQLDMDSDNCIMDTR